MIAILNQQIYLSLKRYRRNCKKRIKKLRIRIISYQQQLGIIVGMSTAVLGSVFFADLALKITGALVQGKGVAFYLDWGIPPVTTAIE